MTMLLPDFYFIIEKGYEEQHNYFNPPYTQQSSGASQLLPL